MIHFHLIVLVVDRLLSVPRYRRYSRVGNIHALFTYPAFWYGEGTVDPAVCVHDASRYTICHTVDGITDVLPGGDQDTGAHQDHDSGLVVKSEDIVVNAYSVKLKKPRELAK